MNGSPVEINIPLGLIEMAKCYPTIDWNEVMHDAVETFDQHRTSLPEVRVSERIASNLAFSRPDSIRSCEVCGSPTIVQFVQTFCMVCHKLICVTCQGGHVHNLGPLVGMPPIDF